MSRRQLLGATGAGVLASAGNADARAGAQVKAKEPGLPAIIDVHAHSQLKPWVDAMVAAGLLESYTSGRGVRWSADAMLADMDEHGIETAILSLPTPISFAGAAAPALARALNEGHAELKTRHPGRFGAYAVVPMNDMKAAIDETAYALDVLKLDGVCTSSNIDGVYMGDPRFDEWFAEMDRRKTVLFVHPNAPKAYPDLGAHVSIIEFMADATRAIMNLVYSGNRQRFPNIKIIATHGGATIPYLAQRLAWLQTQYGPGPGRRKLTGEEVTQSLASFYYDLTAATSPAQLDALLHLVPHTQLLMGFDMPYMSKDFIEPAKRQFLAYPELSIPQKADICRTNPLKLFPALAAASTSSE